MHSKTKRREQKVRLRAWILAGLPPVFHERPPVVPEAVKDAAESRIERILKEKKYPQHSEVKELKNLLEEAGGFFRIYDQGNAVGPEISPDWSFKNREKRARISELLFTSESVGLLIDNLADGLYGPGQIAV